MVDENELLELNAPLAQHGPMAHQKTQGLRLIATEVLGLRLMPLLREA